MMEEDQIQYAAYRGWGKSVFAEYAKRLLCEKMSEMSEVEIEGSFIIDDYHKESERSQ